MPKITIFWPKMYISGYTLKLKKSITYVLKKLLEVICLKSHSVTRYVHFGPKIVIISIFSNYFDKCLPKTSCNAVRTEYQKKTPKT